MTQIVMPEREKLAVTYISFYCAFLLIIKLMISNVCTANELLLTPSFGEQTRHNIHLPRYVQVYQQDFENSPLTGIELFPEGVILTQQNNEVISGSQSIKLTGETYFSILPATSHLEHEKIYVIEFDYHILQASETKNNTVAVGVEWEGLNLAELSNLAGPENTISPVSGTFKRAIRTSTKPVTITFANFGGSAVIDNIRLLRHDVIVKKSAIPLITSGFPRLGNYNLSNAYSTALRNKSSHEDVIQTLGLFDFVTGFEIDNTLFPVGDVQRLRDINPDILILPYFNSFVSQQEDHAPLGGSAGLLRLFNAGLQGQWFMHQPNGERLFEPHFPNHFQMNHTAFSTPVDGFRYTDYVEHFIANSVLPSGLWNGIHFDQSEWYPNPLLTNQNPFLDGPGVLPPIDLDNDGNAENTSDLYNYWQKAFSEYFENLQQKFGSTQLLFGNAGEIAIKPSVLKQLNGMQREFTSPYEILDNGDWNIQTSTGWYELIQRYFNAQQFLRAPQIANFQFTGYRLGTTTDQFTANGLEARLEIPEQRDFRRMRLGLTTVLLGNGFFGYDYVDNTTSPVWFDEYAVNSDGVAEISHAAKGYLGQALGDAIELPFAGEFVFNVDFEDEVFLPDGVYLGQGYIVSADPWLTINGKSAIFFNTPENLQSNIILTSDPDIFSFQQGSTYQLIIDYKVLDYQPMNYTGFISSVMTDTDVGLYTTYRTAALWDPELGQNGTLRTVANIQHAKSYILSSILDTGTIAIDNIKLLKGIPGVFRRDFENGIVLINPTPKDIFVNQADIAGTQNRTGIKRIRGTQAADINNGQAVTNGINIPAADGIILLADSTSAAVNEPPTNIITISTETNATLAWQASAGTVAGYVAQYGIVGGDLTEFEIGNLQTFLNLKNLEPGTLYYGRLYSYNYLGQLSQPSEQFQILTKGSGVSRPLTSNKPILVPGDVATIEGINLSDTVYTMTQAPFPTEMDGVKVLINDVPSAILSIKPGSIRFATPYEIGGDEALLQINNNGNISPTILLPVQSTKPLAWTWKQDDNLAIGFHTDNIAAIDEARPAKPGDRIGLIVSGLGVLEPTPKNGELASNHYTYFQPQVMIDGQDALDVIAFSSPWFAVSIIMLTIPDNIGDGFLNITVDSQNYTSNSVRLFFDNPHN